LFGLAAYALIARHPAHGPLIAAAAVGAPSLCFVLDFLQTTLFESYRIGLEMLLINAAVTYPLLWLVSFRRVDQASMGSDPIETVTR
jgi:hypothetical protein